MREVLAELPEGLVRPSDKFPPGHALQRGDSLLPRSSNGCWLTSWAHAEPALDCKEFLIKIVPKWVLIWISKSFRLTTFLNSSW